jgi:hypothetical protein
MHKVQELLKLFPCKIHRAGSRATLVELEIFPRDFKALNEAPAQTGPTGEPAPSSSRIRDRRHYQKMNG